MPVWSFQTGVVDGGFQTTPLVADGVMYITSSWNRIFALDAETGKELWHYYYAYPKDFRPPDGPWNRGAAIAYGLVFMGTNDNSLVAVDAKTGKEVWKVNIENREQCGCAITGAPLVVKIKWLLESLAEMRRIAATLMPLMPRLAAKPGGFGPFPAREKRAMKPGLGTAGKAGGAHPG